MNDWMKITKENYSFELISLAILKKPVVELAFLTFLFSGKEVSFLWYCLGFLRIAMKHTFYFDYC